MKQFNCKQKIGDGLTSKDYNEYGLLKRLKCGICKTRFDRPIFLNESQSESGYGSCPNCNSQYHSGNFREVEN